MVSFTESGMSGCWMTMILRDFGSVISDLALQTKRQYSHDYEKASDLLKEHCPQTVLEEDLEHALVLVALDLRARDGERARYGRA